MNVKQIVVDELPESCWECKAIQGIPPKYLYCFDRHIDIDVYSTRPSWCPLVVEEVCKWRKDKRHFPYSGVVCFMYVTKCDYEYDDDKVMADWVYCPSCGKRIKYVESEE